MITRVERILWWIVILGLVFLTMSFMEVDYPIDLSYPVFTVFILLVIVIILTRTMPLIKEKFKKKIN
ncbi:hypothetical protein COU56_03010 [Candidatus Pacearchaeota archaeon CG10_big_fil_rev_8_21_14_0_10_31_9]|nr:MAG: hypothetical protein AUJ62_01945 [Candidatus Pacearchaeota archaeon CG1_02_32_21]PIN94237.1 MAG: hypothetical protein COU56_03010 [Candidatus Pacearchaeota archaeon CG10_big_fil_rev_8_21_14_0_10_31_9]PIZ82980.1 MAG: hypothetical protein COX97_01965 [Candidatus Pacearchaeota archaeon CG_4_10_14_0_2_um_filter_05_32_18]